MDEQIFINELANYNEKLREREEEIARLRQMLEQLGREVIHEPESHLFSNAYFQTRLREEILRSERYRHFLSLIIIHIEVKNLCSTDQVNQELRRIGFELMGGLNRRTDIIANFRKRQLVIMLPETDPRGAHILIQRYQMMFPDNGRRLKFSILSYPNDASNIELVLIRLQQISEDLFRGAPALVSGNGTSS